MTLNISTTIKRKWMDKILSGEKTSEFKGDTEFWNKRINKILRAKMNEIGCEEVIITFLCGQISYKYKVLAIHKNIDGGMDIDGIFYKKYWKIELGNQIMENHQDNVKQLQLGEWVVR